MTTDQTIARLEALDKRVTVLERRLTALVEGLSEQAYETRDGNYTAACQEMRRMLEQVEKIT